MPQPEAWGAQPPIELLRLVFKLADWSANRNFALILKTLSIEHGSIMNSFMTWKIWQNSVFKMFNFWVLWGHLVAEEMMSALEWLDIWTLLRFMNFPTLRWLIFSQQSQKYMQREVAMIARISNSPNRTGVKMTWFDLRHNLTWPHLTSKLGCLSDTSSIQ